MELGNFAFGHSRGNYPIERERGYEDELRRLFVAIEGEHFDYHGVHFENETCMTMPYYWGDCSCGFEEKSYAWQEENKCKETCFSVKYSKFCDELQEKNMTLFNENSKAWKESINAWARDHGWTGWEGAGGHCDCGFNEVYEAWHEINSHDTQCPIVRPNFRHKPSGFEIQWYKYPLRDSYMSHQLSVEEFAKVIDGCISSI